MAIIKRDGDIFSRLPNLYDDFLSRSLWDWSNSNFSVTNTTVPAVNISEKGDSFIVEMAAPGMNRNDFKIELDNNILSIRSEKKSIMNNKDENQYSRHEFSYESFQRTFTLPKDVVDSDGINAKYENGVLLLTIPKREEVKQKPKRIIKIS